jgi:alkylated DNA repair dioxygenase AlkB
MNSTTYNLPNSGIIYFPEFFDKDDSFYFYTKLFNNIKWETKTLNFSGREIPIPRLTAWYGDKPYTYSGMRLEPSPWTPTLLSLKSAVEKEANHSFNSALLNLYRDGKDSVGWHSDDEKELGRNPVIASISFGGTRDFKLKHKYENLKETIELTNGSLLIMRGETQHYWQHSIPKTTKKVVPRINLTFRTIY